jgi:uncharacterized OB-fold protein
MATMRPRRRMDPYAEQFWEFTKSREFRLQQCSACGKFRWPPAPVCDGCLSESFEWMRATGRGTLLAWVIFRRQYFHEYPSGHHAGLVELDDGPLFITIPVDESGAEFKDGQELRDGLRMELYWLDAQDEFGEYWLPVFQPAPRGRE